jgi:WD40 repeat protein
MALTAHVAGQQAGWSSQQTAGAKMKRLRAVYWLITAVDARNEILTKDLISTQLRKRPSMQRYSIVRFDVILFLLSLASVFLCQVNVLHGEDQEKPSPNPLTINTAKHRMGNAQSVAVSPDGTLVAAAYGGASNGRFPLKPTDGGIAVWKIDSGEPVQFIGEYGDIVSLSFTTDNKSLLYGRVYTPGDSVDDNVTVLADIESGQSLHRWRCMGGGCVCDTSPTADLLLIENGARICQTLSSADVRAGKTDGTPLDFEGSFAPRSLGISPDGKYFAAVHAILEPIFDDAGVVKPNVKSIRNKGLALFAMDKFEARLRIVNDDLLDCTSVTVSPNGKWIATGHKQGVVRVWNGKEQTPTHKLTLPTEGYVRPVFSPDGSQLAVLTQSAVSRTWKYADTPSGFEFGERQDGATCEVIFYETESFTAVRHWRFSDGLFRTWHANRPLAALNPQRIAFAPSGKQLFIGAGGATLLNIESGQIERQFDVGQTE